MSAVKYFPAKLACGTWAVIQVRDGEPRLARECSSLVNANKATRVLTAQAELRVDGTTPLRSVIMDGMGTVYAKVRLDYACDGIEFVDAA